jgi:DNA-binding NarL/FixJ family response regulator
MPVAKVILVDDQVLFREGIAQLLATQDDVRVVAEAGDGQQAVELALSYRPDLVLMDLSMPRMDGIEATRRIKEALPETKVIILTVSETDDDLFEAIGAGADGYLLKNLKASRLFAKLRGVLEGEAALTPYLATRVLQEFARRSRPEATPQRGGVTEREKEVLQLVVEGCSNREIGLTLSIAESTVKRHLHNILEKLQMQNRAQAAAYAVRTGLATIGRPGES